MIRVKRIMDPSVITDLLKHDELWERVSEDGIEKSSFVVPEDPNFIWMGYYTKKGLIGCFDVHALNMTTLQIHINILKEFREKNAFECGIKILEYFTQTNSGWQKMIAEIPVIMPDVYHFTKKFGFVDEGLNRLSTKKEGRLVDQYRLGITKEEAKKWLQQR